MEKFQSRTKFMESLGATCKNPQWSWSWVNHDKHRVYFGASDVHEKSDSQLILGFGWERNRKGRRNPGYHEALENIELVLGEGYDLYTFRQFQKIADEKTGRVRITGFEQDLELRFLIERIDGWYAETVGDFDEKSTLPKSNSATVYLEGSRVPISRTKIERNRRAREACIKIHGTTCCICGFDFEEYYGDLGRNFIHVHHLQPISESDGMRVVSPQDDLRPVCPNCHAMIHRNGENRSIEEVRSLIL